jgi:hypothetical protein
LNVTGITTYNFRNVVGIGNTNPAAGWVLTNTPPGTGLSVNAAKTAIVIANPGFYQVTFGVMPDNAGGNNPTAFQVQLQLNGNLTGTATYNATFPQYLLEGYCPAANQGVDRFMINLTVVIQVITPNTTLSIANINNASGAIRLKDATGGAGPFGPQAYMTIIQLL